MGADAEMFTRAPSFPKKGKGRFVPFTLYVGIPFMVKPTIASWSVCCADVEAGGVVGSLKV